MVTFKSSSEAEEDGQSLVQINHNDDDSPVAFNASLTNLNKTAVWLHKNRCNESLL